MSYTKSHKTYSEQIELLRARGMNIDNEDETQEYLLRIGYYRLSGYWHAMRLFDKNTGAPTDRFVNGVSFNLVVSLYEFDERLRHAIFVELDRVETAMRSMIGYELGRLNPFIHLAVDELGPYARSRKNGQSIYNSWINRFNKTLSGSKEDFVLHYRSKYKEMLPIWVAIEIMDWGTLSYLYAMSPSKARNRVARQCNLSAPQLESWLRALNVVRNFAAHHARMFNRVYEITPKLSSDKRLEPVRGVTNRVFGMLTLIQYLNVELGLSNGRIMSDVLAGYPNNRIVPFSRVGAPDNWREMELWRS